MKKQTKIISFILALSLIFSSFVFTASATDAGSAADEYSNIEFYEPTATFKPIKSDSDKATITGILGNAKFGTFQNMYGQDGGLETYFVTPDNGNTYLNFVPTANTIANGSLKVQSYFGTSLNAYLTYNESTPTYYVLEYDVAIDSTEYLNFFITPIARNSSGSGMFANAYTPSERYKALITPGEFHHVAMIGDVNANILYVFVDDSYVGQTANGITNTDFFTKFKNGETMRIEGSRFQMTANTKVNANSSFCLDNLNERMLIGADQVGNLAEAISSGNLDNWNKHVNQHAEKTYLPDLAELDGIRYNNAGSLSKVLNTYRLGNKVKILRSCYSAITVNCDATIECSLNEVKLVAGSDVVLAKGGGTSWVAKIKADVFKHTASILPGSANRLDITSSVRYEASDNLIQQVQQNNAVNEKKFNVEQYEALTPEQKACFSSGKLELPAEKYNALSKDEKRSYTPVTETVNGEEVTRYYYYELKSSDLNTEDKIKAFANHGAVGSITVTDSGNQYLIIRDATEETGDFPLNVHYQVNAGTALNYSNGSTIDPYKLYGHTFVVFEQDIYSESSYINVYSKFILRAPNNVALSAKEVYADNISISPYRWYHLTYVGDVATGDSYLFLDGICLTKVDGGLYDDTSLARMATALNIDNTEANRQTLVDNMLLSAFRTMQIAGENSSGQNLNYNMSAASDNYYLRFVDEDENTANSLSDIINAIDSDYNSVPEGSNTPDYTIDSEHLISAWDHDVFSKDYVLPERAVIATINGVPYYDTTSINTALNDTDYTTSIQEIVFYRDYIGTVNVNCRASVKMNGTSSSIKYSDDVTVVTGDTIQVYKQTEADSGNVFTPVASVNGVLYYANGATDENGVAYENTADDLKHILEEDTSSTEFIVTFLKHPGVSITVEANAVLDFNGLNTGVTVNTAECATVVGESTTKVVNLKTTLYVATMNGVDYTNDAEGIAALQAALTEADSVTLSLYNVPTSPLKICCSASIDTNGLIAGSISIDDLVTTDFTKNTITESSGSHDLVITDGSIKYATIEIVVTKTDGTKYSKTVSAQLGQSFDEVLTRYGLTTGVIVEKNGNGTTVNVFEWDNGYPTGTVSREDTAGGYAYTFTATATHSKFLTGKYAYVQNGVVYDDPSFDANKVKNWFGNSAYPVIILNADLLLPNSNINVAGDTHVFLNGYTINTDYTDQVFSFGSTSGALTFYGSGTINHLNANANKALFFTNYGYSKKITVNNVNINTSASIGIIRDSGIELNGCTVDAYNLGALGLFYLGEEYNGYTKSAFVTIRDCDIDYRYYNAVDSYSNFTQDKPLIYAKIVTSDPVNKVAVDDAIKNIVIEGSRIKAQGSILQSNLNQSGNNKDYLKSNTSLYIVDSDIIAKSFVKGEIKPNSILFVDDVRTNIDSLDNIRIATNLLAAKTSDGIYKVLYTSHDFARITWSNGTTEYWAIGSTPTNLSTKFDTIVPGLDTAGSDHKFTSTGTSFPFGLVANLTLSDVIGFNVYVPVQLKNGQKVNHEDVQVYLDGQRVYANTYSDGSVRTTVVAAASGYGDGICYDYTITFAPQAAAKKFTIVIIYGGQYVARTVSVADYANSLIKNGLNEKNKALLQTTLAFIEQATMFAGNTIDMSDIVALRKTLGTKTVAPTEPTAPDVTHAETLADFSQYIKSVQIGINDNCAFRFRLQNGVSAGAFKFYVANDDNTGYVEREFKVINSGNATYLELSLRAYEMARTLKITYNGEYCNYSLYKCYQATVTATSTLSAGSAKECEAAVKLIEALYSYASVCDQYLNTNTSEYKPEA